MSSHASLLSGSLRSISPAHVRVPTPQGRDAIVIAQPDGATPEHVVGWPSALAVGGTTYLAYVASSPQGPRRGGVLTIARADDGESFETIVEFSRRDFSAESIGSPTLVRSADGLWRLYVTVTPIAGPPAISVIEALDPALFDPATARTVVFLARRGLRAISDVHRCVIRQFDGRWHLWMGVNNNPEVVMYASSYDGVEWTVHEEVLTPVVGTWCESGVRPADVCQVGTQLLMYFDGRSSGRATEQTGVAVGSSPRRFRIMGETPFVSSEALVDTIDLRDGNAGGNASGNGQDDGVTHGGVRRMNVVVESSTRWRIFYEYVRPDGSGELRTELAEGISSIVVDLTPSAATKTTTKSKPASRAKRSPRKKSES